MCLCVGGERKKESEMERLRGGTGNVDFCYIIMH